MKICLPTSLCILLGFLVFNPKPLLAQVEEEYDDLYFMANDRNVIAKNTLLESKKQKETNEKELNGKKELKIENSANLSVQDLNSRYQFVPQVQLAGGLFRRPQLMISFGQTFGNQALLWNDPFSYSSSQPYFGAAAFDPWGRNYFYRYGWNPSAMWYSNRYFAPSYYSAFCPTYYNSPSWVSNNATYSSGSSRKVYKGARNSRNTGFPTHSSVFQSRTNANSSLVNPEKENQIQQKKVNSNPYSSNTKGKNSWQQNNQRRSRSVFENPSNSESYNQNKPNNPSRNSWSNGRNNNRSRSSSFGNLGGNRSSSGGSKSGSKSSGGRTRGRN